MAQSNDAKAQSTGESDEMRQQIFDLENTLRVQRQVAYAAGLFQGDVTVRTLLESLAEGLIVHDHSGIIVLVNRRTEEIFGYSQEEIVGQPLTILLPQRFVQTHARYTAEYFENPRVRPMGQGLDLVAKHKDGTEFPIEISLSFLHTEAGLMGLAFVTDITLRKQAEKDLKERNEALDAFAHTVAHELNTSLALLVGYSETLVESHETMSPEEIHPRLVAIARNSHRMNNTVRELLLLASIRKEDIELEHLDMKDIVVEALQRLQYEIQKYQGEIILPDSYPVTLGYAPWVEAVWFNYINNALKYGGRPPRVEIGSMVQDDGYVRFWVRDNGEGLSPEQQEQLFTPFTRLGRSRVKGHGLGLSIARRITEKLGGQVGAASQVGKGSTFSFTLRAAGRD